MLKRQQSREDEGIDVDDAIEKLDITEHNPQKYLDILKKSVEGDPNSALKVRIPEDISFSCETFRSVMVLPTPKPFLGHKLAFYVSNTEQRVFFITCGSVHSCNNFSLQADSDNDVTDF